MNLDDTISSRMIAFARLQLRDLEAGFGANRLPLGSSLIIGFGLVLSTGG
jgi:hypothetical protein